MVADEPILIIGGGIAGITVGHVLAEAGLPFTLIEAADRVGGVIQTRVEGPYLMERGPFSYLPKATVLPQLIAAWELTDQVVAADVAVAGNRYVLARGQIYRVPLTPREFLSSRLFSWGAKVRLLLEPWAAGPPAGEETIAAFVRRRAGRALLDQVIQPFVSGVVAGDAEALSVAALFPRFVALERDYGSLLRAFRARSVPGGTRPTLYSFRRGMQTLPEAFAARYRPQIVTGARVTALGRTAAGWRVTWTAGGIVRHQEASHVVVATPAYVAAELLAACDEPLARGLAAITYAPLVLVHVVYQRSQCRRPLDGFGFLATKGSGAPLLGSIWASSIFAGRAGPDELLVTWFLGGALYPEAIAGEDARILACVRAVGEQVLGLGGGSCHPWIDRYARAIPQYYLGHTARVTEITARAQALGGLHLVGSYIAGVSIDDTAGVAQQRAGALVRAVRS